MATRVDLVRRRCHSGGVTIVALIGAGVGLVVVWAAIRFMGGKK